MILLTAVYYVCWSFGLVFLICEIGEHIQREFSEINNAISQSEWYSFPFEVKRTLPTVLYNAQKHVRLECFGSKSCSRRIFKEVSENRLKKFNKQFPKYVSVPFFSRFPIKRIHTSWYCVSFSNDYFILTKKEKTFWRRKSLCIIFLSFLLREWINYQRLSYTESNVRRKWSINYASKYLPHWLLNR